MIIKEQFIEFVPNAIARDGEDARMTVIEIKQLISKKYGINWNNIIPSDYCYNDEGKISDND